MPQALFLVTDIPYQNSEYNSILQTEHKTTVTGLKLDGRTVASGD